MQPKRRISRSISRRSAARTLAQGAVAALVAGDLSRRLEAAERAAAIRTSLDRLPAKLREVIVLRFYADDSLEGIAAALGCPVGTVKSRLFHGLESLRRMKAIAGERKS